jgi:hypothetical protein
MMMRLGIVQKVRVLKNRKREDETQSLEKRRRSCRYLQ